MHLLRPLRWTSGLEIGVPEIDDDHRRLAQDSNALLGLLDEGDAAARLLALVRQMQKGFIEHFRREEGILLDSGYPDAKTHLAEHGRIEQVLDGVVADLHHAPGGSPEADDLAVFFRTTLIDHLLMFDMRYKSHLLWRRGR
jgi:hemerythrin-like metal-binding protein